MNKADNTLTSIKKIMQPLFPTASFHIERVTEGSSTWVYRIRTEHAIYYLRVLPEEGASFAPEAEVHTQLRQRKVHVPEVIYVEDYNPLLQRSIMLTTEITGTSISSTQQNLSKKELEYILRTAGQELAHINSLPVKGFGWIKRESQTTYLEAEYQRYDQYMLESWEADISFLSQDVLTYQEISQLEKIIGNNQNCWQTKHGYLAHGDFDVTHIYHQNGVYTGIIDFGEIRGTDQWYDLGHFHMRDGESGHASVLTDLLKGFADVITLPDNWQQQLYFASIGINIKALARSLRKRPANQFTNHQVEVLRKDIEFFR